MEILEKLLSNLKVQKDKSKWLKYFWWALAAIVALLLVGILTFQLVSKSKKTAKALHQVDVLTEEKNIAKANAQVAESEEEFQKHIKNVEKIDKKLKKLRREAHKSDTAHKQAKALIDRIQSWDDVDQVIKH